MALSTGSVSVDDAGTVTKSGAAGRLYDKLEARLSTELAKFGKTLADSEATNGKKALANQANDIASWLVTEIQKYARARITTSDAGLQRTPNPNNADTATQAPSASKYLVII